nr:hypothetical protein [Rhodopirellula sp. SM50]
MGVRKVRLKIGDVQRTRQISPSQICIVYEINLPVGEMLLQSWVTDARSNTQRGAYFAN